MSYSQLPAYLWDKGTLITLIFDSACLVNVFFFALLMTLVTTHPGLESNQIQRQQEQRARPKKRGNTTGMNVYGS